MAKRKLKVKVSGYAIVSDALNSAVVAAMNKCDKYCEPALTNAQRDLIANHLDNYFWIALDDAGAEVE